MPQGEKTAVAATGVRLGATAAKRRPLLEEEVAGAARQMTIAGEIEAIAATNAGTETAKSLAPEIGNGTVNAALTATLGPEIATGLLPERGIEAARRNRRQGAGGSQRPLGPASERTRGAEGGAILTKTILHKGIRPPGCRRGIGWKPGTEAGARGSTRVK